MAVESSRFQPMFMAFDTRESLEEVRYSEFSEALAEYRSMTPRYRAMIQDSSIIVPMGNAREVTLRERFNDQQDLTYRGYFAFEKDGNSSLYTPKRVNTLGELIHKFHSVIDCSVPFGREVVGKSLDEKPSRRKK